MNFNDAISILELPNVFTDEELELAYKRLAVKYHPDKGGNKESMARLSEAKLLLKESKKSKALITVEQFEVLVRTMNTEVQQHKSIEKKVEKLEKEIRNHATNRLKSIKNSALIFAAISAGAFFLGKEIPKDILSTFLPTSVARPLVVEPPVLSPEIKGIVSNSKDMLDQDITEDTKALLDKYYISEANYIKYGEQKEIYDFNERRVKLYKSMWYFLTFGIAIYAGIIAWFFNHKVHRIEIEISELYDELSIKSRYVSFLRRIFSDDIQTQWSITELEESIDQQRHQCRSMHVLSRYLGARKLAQLLIAKGQEQAFLVVTDGNESNDYREMYSIS